MKHILILFLSPLVTFSLFAGESKNESTQLEKSIETYNSVVQKNVLIDLLSMNATDEDVKFLNQFRGESLPTAKLQGDKIFYSGTNQFIQLINPKNNLYLINGKEVKIDVSMSISKNIKQIENALATKNSKFNIFVPQAQALVNSITLGIYGTGAAVTALVCGLIVYDIFGGSCEAKTADDQIIHLKLKDSPGVLHNLLKLKVKNDGSSFKVLTKDVDKKDLSMIEVEKIPDTYLFGDDDYKSLAFVNELKKICSEGGTKALNTAIRNTKEIKLALKKLQQAKQTSSDNSMYDRSKPSGTGQ